MPFRQCKQKTLIEQGRLEVLFKEFFTRGAEKEENGAK